MANEEKKNQETNGIDEKDLVEIKEPWWKKTLKIGGYILAGAVGLLGGLLIGNHMGDDDDNDTPAEDHPAE